MDVAKLVDVRRIDLFREEIRDPGPGQVLVKVGASGICGSDIHYFEHGGLGSFKVGLPMELGHEVAGTVEATHNGSRFDLGDKVAIEPASPCGVCRYCLRGRHNLCSDGGFMGASGTPAGLREFILCEEDQLGRLESGTTFEEGAMVEPLGIAYHAVRLSKLQIGDSVAIFGAGAIGLLITALAKLGGASKVFVVDKLAYRLDNAKNIYDADQIIEEGSGDSIQKIKEATSGHGVDVAFDAAGMQNTVDGCFQVAARGGSVILVGIPTYDHLNYNPHLARLKELEILNVRRSNRTLTACVDLIESGVVSVKELVTHRYALHDSQLAFETAADYVDGIQKAVITF